MSLAGQQTATITPNKSALDERVANELHGRLSQKLRLQDPEMSMAAFQSSPPDAPFNMSSDDARRIGSVLGCDFYILIRTGTQRRAAIELPDHFEAFAAVFTVSSRTGRLIDWRLLSADDVSDTGAEKKLIDVIATASTVIATKISRAGRDESNEPMPTSFEQVPDPDSAAARNFRSPVPYSRIKPEYTRTAHLYDVTATVDIAIDLDEKGQIVHTQIDRWAGYGLDESVLAAVMSMNWRPAERNGKPLPARFLLRYNFRKIEKE